MLVFGLVRGALLIQHEPLLGYANNFDFFRAQTCLGVWQMRDDGLPVHEASPERPLTWYNIVESGPDWGNCHYSSDLLPTGMAVVYAAARAALAGRDSIETRDIGTFLLLLHAATATGLAVWLCRRQQPCLAMVFAALFALFVMDPVNTLFLNTFYQEKSALLFALAAGTLAVAGIGQPLRPVAACVFGATLVLLGTSKFQHFLLPSVFVIAFGMAWWLSRRAAMRRLFAVSAIAACLVIVVQGSNRAFLFHETIGRANATNAYLYSIMGESPDPVHTARVLGLPDRCAAYAGMNWWAPALNPVHPCPEVFDIPRLRIFALVAQDPETVVNLLRAGIMLQQPWFMPEVGQVAEASYARLPETIPTLARAVARLPVSIYALLYVLPGLAAIGSVLWLALRRRDREPVLFPTVVLLLAGQFYYVFLSVLFGDGYADLVKQSNLLFTTQGALLLTLAAWLFAALAGLRRPIPIEPVLQP
ncbi:MAG: hypothetical protein GVY13_02495 [Alphaproteobacteria bacterium]|jgi:hypothetical protein|nr:hypothetical protein [Alphaproteobacteria bacterium]